MFYNFQIKLTEENNAKLINKSQVILEEIITAYNECNSFKRYEEMARKVISILEENFDYSY